MLGHDVPETIGFRPIRSPLVHQNGRSIGQRAIDNVTVPGDPTDICRAPVNIIILEVKDVFGGELGTQQVTSGGMQNPLGLASGSTGVEDEERMLTAELCRRTDGRCFGDFLMPPEIPSFFHGDLVLCSAENDHGFNGPGDGLTLDLDLEGVIDIFLEGDNASAAITAIRG